MNELSLLAEMRPGNPVLTMSSRVYLSGDSRPSPAYAKRPPLGETAFSLEVVAIWAKFSNRCLVHERTRG